MLMAVVQVQQDSSSARAANSVESSTQIPVDVSNLADSVGVTSDAGRQPTDAMQLWRIPASVNANGFSDTQDLTIGSTFDGPLVSPFQVSTLRPHSYLESRRSASD